MPLAKWPLLNNRPVIQITLKFAQGGHQIVRNLLADTGAGNSQAGFELLLDEQDCLLSGANPLQDVVLGGAYVGSFPAYLFQVEIPALGFAKAIPAVGV
ncbi:MAG: hypothetical protein U0793_28865 [Gemmataceae bacterium]